MNKMQRFITSALTVFIILACNLPSGASTQAPASNDSSATPTAANADTATTTSTPAPLATACSPTVVTNVDSNVRSGPGQVYGVLGQLLQGTTANVAGKNADGTWWYIEFAAGPNGHAWIAGSITTANCIPDTLAIIADPPTPIPPTYTFTPIPSATPTITNTPHPIVGLTLVLPFPPILIAQGDIAVQDVFLSSGGEVVARIGISGVISGSFKYKVYVDGGLKATKVDTLPASGSQVYYSGVVLAPNIFDQTNNVKVVVDPDNALSETDEGNNQGSASCNNVSRAC